jgi:hypothetical protein
MTAAASKYIATAPSGLRNAVGNAPGAAVATNAVEPSDAGAHRNQREHVEIAGHQRLPALLRRTASLPPSLEPRKQLNAFMASNLSA